MKHHDVKVCECGAQAWAATKFGVLTLDADNRHLLDEYWWTVKRSGKTIYAESPRAAEHGLNRLLHRNVVRGAPLLDHRDRNGLSNMRDNLRVTDKRGNTANIRPRKGRKYRGIKLDSRMNLTKRWIARLAGKHLGRFVTADDAAKAFDIAAASAFGAEARLNLP